MAELGPEPEPELGSGHATELIRFLEHADAAVVDQALEAVVSLTGDADGIKLLRDLEPYGHAATTLLQLITRAVDSPKRQAQAAVALVNLSGALLRPRHRYERIEVNPAACGLCWCPPSQRTRLSPGCWYSRATLVPSWLWRQLRWGAMLPQV